MNEFIVWDEKNNVFLDTHKFALSMYGHIMLLNQGKIIDVVVDKRRHLICRYIEKTDIEDKEIYADSSIVEFSHTAWEAKRLIGSFEYNPDELRYEINIYNDDKAICLNYNYETMSKFKIIGTLQENPELLK